MRSRKLRFVSLYFLAVMTRPATLESAEPSPPLEDYIVARTAEFDQISADRRELLNEISAFGRSQRLAGRPIRLTFICTHNSRRSQLAQVWATLAAAHYGVTEVEAFSGGTERAAFNPCAVAALTRAGVNIESRSSALDGDNRRYEVRFGRNGERLLCFSKVYNEPPNPKAGFAAVMTCSEADKKCPVVSGAAVRIALHYDDPKVADGSKDEAKVYDERCAQIAREMLFAFSRLSTNG